MGILNYHCTYSPEKNRMMKKKSTNKLSMLPEYILEAGNKKAVGKAACVKYKSSGSYYIRSSRSKTQKWAIVLSNLEEAHSP